MSNLDKNKIGLYKSKGYGFAKEFIKPLEKVYGKIFTPHEVHKILQQAKVPTANGMYLKELALLMIHNRKLDKIILGVDKTNGENYSDYYKIPPYDMPEADMDTISKLMIKDYQTEEKHNPIKKIFISESQYKRLFKNEGNKK